MRTPGARQSLEIAPIVLEILASCGADDEGAARKTAIERVLREHDLTPAQALSDALATPRG